jgi:hypothetical protein
MKNVVWKPCRTDCDLWIQAETHPKERVMYWAYMCIYVDDSLCVHHNPGTSLTKLDEYFKMKERSIQAPTFYLGVKLKNTVLPNGVVAWGMSSSKYAQSAVQNVKEYLGVIPRNNTMLMKSPTPFTGGYKTEIDESPELGPVIVNFFKSHIGILR